MSLMLPSTLVELRRCIVSGEISADEALGIQKAQLSLDANRWNSIVHQTDSQHQRINCTGSLAGVGLAHKDIFQTNNRLPVCGYSRQPPETKTCGNSTVIQNLENNGAQTLAMLAMAEFASGATGENPAYNLPMNPVYPGAMVGGSSSGSATAVAAGLCYGSLGTDTAGSVRIPAATCGLLGLKPTRSLLSLTGCYPLAPSLDTVGLFARSARDATQLLAACLSEKQRSAILPAIQLTDDSLPTQTWNQRLNEDLRLPASTRIRVVLEHSNPSFSLDQLQHAVLESYLDTLKPCVSSIDQSALNGMNEWVRLVNIIMHVEAAATLSNRLHTQDALNPITRATSLPGTAIPATWYAQAVHAASQNTDAFVQQHLSEHDIVLTPVFPQGVPDWDEVLTTSTRFNPKKLLGLFSWTSFVNYLGLPAIVFPIGLDTNHRPVSVQAIGRPHSEHLLLALAHQFESEHCNGNGFIAKPPALEQTLNNREQHHA